MSSSPHLELSDRWRDGAETLWMRARHLSFDKANRELAGMKKSSCMLGTASTPSPGSSGGVIRAVFGGACEASAGPRFASQADDDG